MDELISGYSRHETKSLHCRSTIDEPKILLDEPTVGLDPRSARLVKDILRGWRIREERFCPHIYLNH